MKAIVVHNPTAGQAVISRDELLDAIRRAGFEPSYFSTKKRGYKRALQDPGAAVFAVGGDGTVVKVARELRGSDVPVTIVPVGTANNIAESLRLPQGLADAIATASSGHRVPFDLGLARASWGKKVFAEGIGFGLFPYVLTAGRQPREPGELSSVEQELSSDVAHWLERIAEAEARSYAIEVDGRDLSGEYLMVEVLNIALLGPRLRFAPGASSSDGELEVVLVRPADGPRLQRFLEERLAGGDAEWSGSVVRGKRIEIRWADGVPRLDDDLWEPGEKERKKSGEYRLAVRTEARAIEITRR